MPCCPHCHRSFDEAAPNDTLHLDPATVLRMGCDTLGITPTWDGFVGEADAARLIGRKAKTLHNRRHASGSLPHRKGPGRWGRVEYALSDLAEYISNDREKSSE
jgi:hypothetical protein